MTPLQLVDLLNEVFQCFDGLRPVQIDREFMTAAAR